jgi:hypothetical protein
LTQEQANETQDDHGRCGQLPDLPDRTNNRLPLKNDGGDQDQRNEQHRTLPDPWLVDQSPHSAEGRSPEAWALNAALIVLRTATVTARTLSSGG